MGFPFPGGVGIIGALPLGVFRYHRKFGVLSGKIFRGSSPKSLPPLLHVAPWHFLYFKPEPHGHLSFIPTSSINDVTVRALRTRHITSLGRVGLCRLYFVAHPRYPVCRNTSDADDFGFPGIEDESQNPKCRVIADKG